MVETVFVVVTRKAVTGMSLARVNRTANGVSGAEHLDSARRVP
jgi:hypothetical protein